MLYRFAIAVVVLSNISVVYYIAFAKLYSYSAAHFPLQDRGGHIVFALTEAACITIVMIVVTGLLLLLATWVKGL